MNSELNTKIEQRCSPMGANDVSLSINIFRQEDDVESINYDADAVRPIASVGKVILLAEIAELITNDVSFAAKLINRESLESVADTGLWQYMGTNEFSILDLAYLTASVSDNLATNALINFVGIDALKARSQSFGIENTLVHDLIRDQRTPETPSMFASGTTKDLSSLFTSIEFEDNLNPKACKLLKKWLSTNTNLSLIPAPLGIDPLAHTQGDRTINIYNKTGSDQGLRCDAGVIKMDELTIIYSAIGQWQQTSIDDPGRENILDWFHEIGNLLKSEN